VEAVQEVEHEWRTLGKTNPEKQQQKFRALCAVMLQQQRASRSLHILRQERSGQNLGSGAGAGALFSGDRVHGQGAGAHGERGGCRRGRLHRLGGVYQPQQVGVSGDHGGGGRQQYGTSRELDGGRAGGSQRRFPCVRRGEEGLHLRGFASPDLVRLGRRVYYARRLSSHDPFCRPRRRWPSGLP